MTLETARWSRVRPRPPRARARSLRERTRTLTRAMVKQLTSRDEFNAIKAAGKPVRATSIAAARTSERAGSRRDRSDRRAVAIAIDHLSRAVTDGARATLARLRAGCRGFYRELVRSVQGDRAVLR